VFYIIILIVQQNYFSDLYSTKILNRSFRAVIQKIHGKNNFVKVAKNLVRYRSENNLDVRSK